MLRAVYVRTLKPGITDDQYIEAWMPEGASRDEYPARAVISHSTTNERQTVTTFDLDVEPDDFLDALGALVHPDWRERVAEVIESSELESITVIAEEYGSVGSPHVAPSA